MPIVVQTVLGAIEPDSLGFTLSHEHLSVDFNRFYIEPPSKFEDQLKDEIALKNLGYIRQYPYSSRDNIRLNDDLSHKAIKRDVKHFRKLCGRAIVEHTSLGLARDLEFLCDLSKCSDVHIISGTGHYGQTTQDADHEKMTVEELSALYMKELTSGVEVPDGENVKCGFIGEVGSTYPINEFEKRSIQATGVVQGILGCGVSFSPACCEKAPFEIVRLYLEAGGRANKCVMSHIDRTFTDIEKIMEFADLGTYLQYDFFGMECSFNQLNKSVDIPSDAQRMNDLTKLVKDDLGSRLLISHDIFTKHRLTSFGGHGFHHISNNIIPRLCDRGLTDEDIDKIVVQNPANWLKFYGCESCVA